MTHKIGIGTIEYLMKSHVPWQPGKIHVGPVELSKDDLIHSPDIHKLASMMASLRGKIENMIEPI